MKKVISLLMAVLMVACLLAACGNSNSAENSGKPSEADPTVVNLMDMYSVKDPDGVEYDQRVALYAPVLESDESYATGVRHNFAVLYGKDGKGVYMYSVDIFDTEDSAKAYAEDAGQGTVDGTVVVTTSDASFFATMESFVPDLQTWIDNMMMSGMVEVD